MMNIKIASVDQQCLIVFSPFASFQNTRFPLRTYFQLPRHFQLKNPFQIASFIDFHPLAPLNYICAQSKVKTIPLSFLSIFSSSLLSLPIVLFLSRVFFGFFFFFVRVTREHLYLLSQSYYRSLTLFSFKISVFLAFFFLFEYNTFILIDSRTTPLASNRN